VLWLENKQKIPFTICCWLLLLYLHLVRFLRALSLGLLITLLNWSQRNTTTTWQSDVRLLALTNDEDIVDTRGERVLGDILNVHNVVRTFVLLDTLQLTNTTQVTTRGDHDQRTDGEFDRLLNLASLQVELDRVVLLDRRVRIADRATIVAANGWHALAASVGLSHFQQLEASFFWRNQEDHYS